MANLLMQPMFIKQFSYRVIQQAPGIKFQPPFTNTFNIGVQTAPSSVPELPGGIILLSVHCDVLGKTEDGQDRAFAQIEYEVGAVFQQQDSDTNENLEELLHTEGLALLANAARGHLYALCKGVSAPLDVLFPLLDLDALEWSQENASAGK